MSIYNVPCTVLGVLHSLFYFPSLSTIFLLLATPRLIYSLLVLNNPISEHTINFIPTNQNPTHHSLSNSILYKLFRNFYLPYIIVAAPKPQCFIYHPVLYQLTMQTSLLVDCKFLKYGFYLLVYTSIHQGAYLIPSKYLIHSKSSIQFCQVQVFFLTFHKNIVTGHEGRLKKCIKGTTCRLGKRNKTKIWAHPTPVYKVVHSILWKPVQT